MALEARACGMPQLKKAIVDDHQDFEKESIFDDIFWVYKCARPLPWRRPPHTEGVKNRRCRGKHVPGNGGEEIDGQAKPQHSLHERPDDLLVRL